MTQRLLHADGVKLTSAPQAHDEAKLPLSPPIAPAMPAWSIRRVAQTTLVALGVAILFLLLYRFYMVVFIFFVAVTLQIAMKPAVLRMRKYGIREEVGVTLIYAVALTSILLFIWLVAPLLFEQTGIVMQQIPEYYESWRLSLIESENRFVHAFGLGLPWQFSQASAEMNEAADVAASDQVTSAWEMFSYSSYIFFVIVAVFMLAYYWTLEGDYVIRRLLYFIRPERRESTRTILQKIESKIGSYFRGQVILCLIVGGLSVAGYIAIGLPYALGLGAIMGLLEAIPMIGPILGAVPAILIALTAAPDKLLWVIGVVSLIQFLENNLLVPKIMDQSVGINAIVTILAIAAFGILFGVGGAILAIPLAVVLQILFDHFVLHISDREDANLEGQTANVASRSLISALRVEAQDLTKDLRKQRVLGDISVLHEETGEVEDILESIADDLDGLLSQLEGAA